MYAILLGFVISFHYCTTSYDRTITAVMQWGASSQSGLPSTVMLVLTLVYLNTVIKSYV